MKVKLKLFYDWGIKFEEPYRIKEQVNRKVVYADREELEEAIQSNASSNLKHFDKHIKKHKTKVCTD